MISRNENGRVRNGPLLVLLALVVCIASAARVFADTYAQTGILNLGMSNTDGAMSSPIWNARPITSDPSNAQNGDYWFNLNTQTWRGQNTQGVFGITPGFKSVIIADGTTITNPTTVQTFSTAFTFPANSLVAGNHVKFHARGRYSTGAVANNLTFAGTLNAVNLASIGSLAITQSATNLAWSADQEFVVRTTGATGTLVAGITGQVAAAGTDNRRSGRVGSTTFDTTAGEALSLTVINSSSDAAMTLTMEEAEFQVEN